MPLYPPPRAMMIALRATEYYANWAIPAALTEFNAQQATRALVDLSLATQVRFTSGQVGDGLSGAKLRLQYSIDSGSNWNYMDGGTGPEVTGLDTYAVKDSGWVNLVGAARTPTTLVRCVGLDGNGSEATFITTLYLHWR